MAITSTEFAAANARGRSRLRTTPHAVAASYDQTRGMVVVQLYLPARPEGLLSSKAWAAARMGQEGGKAQTPAKQAASRANGRLGGRPRKMT